MIQTKINFAIHLPVNGYAIKIIQEHFIYKDVSTTMIYTCVFHRGGLDMRSPFDGLIQTV